MFLVLGVLSFIVYSVFFYFFRESRLLLLAFNKLVTNAGFIGFALIGTMQTRSLRNIKLIEVLIFYALGDVLSVYSVPAGGILYLAGHLVLIRSLYITTLVTRKNVIWFVIIAVFSALALLILFRDNPGMVPVYMLYALILTLKLSLTISNPIYFIASLVFFLSDALGVYRSLNFGASRFGFCTVTLAIYYASIVIFAFASYKYEAKPVVTWNNMTVLARNMAKGGVRFCFTYGWGKDIAAGKYMAMHSDAYIAVDISDKVKAEQILSRMEYKLTESFDEFNLHVYYSNLFGFLNVSFRTFTEDGIILGKKVYRIKNCRSLFLKSGIPVIIMQPE